MHFPSNEKLLLTADRYRVWSGWRRRGRAMRRCYFLFAGSHSIERYGFVFVNCLALVIVFGMFLTVCSGNSLRGFIRFEAQVACFMFFGAPGIAQTRVAEH